ncbi:signal peptidase II [uncultured Anaerococcus sp.]|uniref:signal peptidase II n=1 Tax=uncultured Anaerococcus sp. TaxID=293428 RepID=UPI00261D3BB4|nr:signal peptidase II [uncultured Anaerococcus sp.]
MKYIIMIILGFIIDRITKVYAINNFIDNPYDGSLLNFTYLENRGAAFGILQDSRIFFIILTIVIVGYLLYYFIKNYRTNMPILNLALAFIISGALGNFYDRLLNGYVVDFIEFAFVNFPIFNFADILVTVGSILVIIYLIFFEESEKKNER